jgi:plastocyanin
MATTEKSRTRRPEVLVPVLGLVYVTLVLLYVMVVTNFAPFSFIFVPFMVAYLVSAYAIRRGSKWGYVASAAGSAIFLLLQSSRIGDFFGAVTLPGEFLSGMTAVMVLLSVFIYSVLGVRQVWRKGALPSPPPRMIPVSSLVILLVLGFIIGGIVVGFVAADTERRLLGTSTADITIVPGAGSQTNPQFYSPANFAVKAGSTVTWVNHDGSSHTVTSQGSTLFDSGNIPTGGTFSYKFTQPGTYQYYCTIHPWMKGTIVVTTG